MIKKINIFIILFLLFFSTSVFAAFTVENEIELGKSVKEQVDKKYPVSKNIEKQKKLVELGNKLTPYLSRHDYNYVFTMIEMGKDGPNAFAVPGGYVYFDETLWDIMDESSRMGILAHEITHVDRKHSLKQQEKNMWTSIGLAVLLGVTKASNVAQVGASLFKQVLSNNYSISDEKEADIKGTELLISANADPLGVLNSMRIIERMENGSLNSVPSFLLDHPKTVKRIDYLSQYLEDKGINVPSVKIYSKYPVDVIGIINDVDIKNNKYDTLSFDPNDKNIEYKVGDVIFIDQFIWNSTYKFKIPVSVASCIIEEINKDKTIDLKVKEIYDKTSEIKVGDIVCLSKILKDDYKTKYSNEDKTFGEDFVVKENITKK